MMSGVRASSTRIEFDFVDDREIVTALNHLGPVVFHIVAQIVEAELVVRRVGDVAGISRVTLLVGQAVDDDARRHSEEAVEATHASCYRAEPDSR